MRAFPSSLCFMLTIYSQVPRMSIYPDLLMLENQPFVSILNNKYVDTLRALMLEWAGYDTKILEFVSSEHTAKNVMIAAVKRRQLVDEDKKKENKNNRVTIVKKITDIMQLFGITNHRLKDLLFEK